MAYKPATISFTSVADALLWAIENSSMGYSNATLQDIIQSLRDHGITRVSGIDSEGYDAAYDYDLIIEGTLVQISLYPL